jgi:uncharacterized LabA/DUF88 family protein
MSGPKLRAVFFFDGQNLFHAAKELFGYAEANYDPVALSRRLCERENWELGQVRFYTGTPRQDENPTGFRFWNAKLQSLRNNGAYIFQRPLRYRSKSFTLPLGRRTSHNASIYLPNGEALIPGESLQVRGGHELPEGTRLSVRVGEEKGIDVRLALDLIGLTLSRAFDVAVLFTQDQDQTEAVREAKTIAKGQSRFIRLYSAFPSADGTGRGVEETQWIRIDRETYDSCLDRRDCRDAPRRRR